jgi:DNA invertase Pin-like site-specific DNA recombinase
MKNAVIYTRYSAGPDQDENSIIGQLRVCREYAAREGYTIIKEYCDRAISGKEAENRFDFLRMIDDATKKKFEFVIVYQLDRFARNRYDSATYKSKLKKCGVRVVSARETISDDASGILMEAVLEGMAEYYSVELSQKVKRGYETKAAQLIHLGGYPPLGLKLDEERHYIIDEATAPYVRHIFELYANGTTIREINIYLNENGVKTRLGHNFTKNSLSSLFQNEKYIGTYRRGDFVKENAFSAIISREIFERTQARMAEKKKASSKGKAVEEYLLTPRLFCGHCHELMTGKSGTSHTGKFHSYYKCNGAHKGNCNKKTVRKHYIEDIVINWARSQLTDDNIKKISTEIEKIFIAEQENNSLNRLRKELKETEKAIENLMIAMEKGELNDMIFERIKAKKSQAEEIKLQITKEEIIFDEIDATKIKFFLYKLKNGDADDIKYKRALITTFVNKIYLYDDRMTIFFNSTNKKSEVTIDLLAKIEGLQGSTEGNFSAFLAFRKS